MGATRAASPAGLGRQHSNPQLSERYTGEASVHAYSMYAVAGGRACGQGTPTWLHTNDAGAAARQQLIERMPLGR